MAKNRKNKVYIYGGGRWAKVIIKVLIDMNVSKNELFIITNYNKKNIQKWLVEEELVKKITVISKLSFKEKNCEEFFIVVNNAKAHYSTIREIIPRQAKILFEKPISLSMKDANHLINLANKNKSLLLPANVFLFSEYLSAFKSFLPSGKSIKGIKFFWGDKKNEIRYNIKKTFDNSAPIYTDVLPTISSFLLFLFPDYKLDLKKACLLGDGSFFIINAVSNDIKCKISLQRNGKQRVRILKINYSDGMIMTLDFSDENVYIFKNKKIIKTFQFNGALKNMLTHFLMNKSLSALDDRFNLKYAINYIKDIEQINNIYPDLRENFFKKLVVRNYKNKAIRKKTLAYSFSEIIQKNKKLSDYEITKKFNEFLNYNNIPTNYSKDLKYD